jgi:hypothetical protein
MFFEYTTRTAVADLTLGSIAGSDAVLTSATDALPAAPLAGDYVTLSGFTDPNNNGVWLLVAKNSPENGSWNIQRYDSTLTITAEGPVAGNVDENPINSPDSIIVNSATTFSPLPITGLVAGSSQSYDFDYDNNNQGGRTAATIANVVVRAIGLDLAQFVETSGTIQRSTTNNFSLVAPLERNFSNP